MSANNLSKKSVWLLISGLFLALILVVLAEARRDWLPAVDGPYQTINACRQIMGGAMPGRDFMVFHGLGTVWYHSFFYALLGGTVAGSVAAYVTACMAVVWMPSTLAGRFAGLSRSWALVMGLVAVNGMLLIPPPVYDAVFPGGNMLGTRISLSLTIALVAWRIFQRTQLSPVRLGMLAGCVPGFALLVSQEQGMSLGAAVVFSALWFCLVRRQFGFGDLLKGALGSLVTLLGIYFGGVFVLSGGSPASYLHFAWVEIPQNQFWFFGKPPKCIIEPSDLIDVKEILFPAVCALLFWLLAFVVRWKFRVLRAAGSERRLEGALLCFLIIYCIGSLHPLAGYKGQHYFAPAIHAGLIACVIAIAPLVPWLREKWGERRLLVVLGVVTLAFCGMELGKNQLRTLIKKGKGEPPALVLIEGGAGVPDNGAEMGEAERVRRFVEAIGPNGKVWGTFSGPVEEALGQAPNSRFDYVIYALSEESEVEYLESFQEFAPTHVITGRESSGWIFQWMMKRYWRFYREVALNFEPVMAVNGRVLWRRRDLGREDFVETEVQFSTKFETQGAKLSFEVEAPDDEVTLHEVRLRYRLKNPPVPILSQRLTRLGVRAKGVPNWQEIGIRVKQNDEWTDFEFPVIVTGSRSVELDLRVISPFGAPEIEFEKIEVVRLDGGSPLGLLVLQNDRLAENAMKKNGGRIDE